ncbi:hypothetical protein F7725_020307, partial [Dissostichus mawsoni]
MVCFPYSPHDLRDRPCPINVSTLTSNDNTLKQSSEQMLILLKILPFLQNNVKESLHMCMRFESKHRFFKRWASKLNFKNICKTLVQLNQRFECSHNVNGRQHPIFSNEKELGPTSEV